MEFVIKEHLETLYLNLLIIDHLIGYFKEKPIMFTYTSYIPAHTRLLQTHELGFLIVVN